MKSLAVEMKSLIDKVLVLRGECPKCQQPLYGYKAKEQRRFRSMCADMYGLWLL